MISLGVVLVSWLFSGCNLSVKDSKLSGDTNKSVQRDHIEEIPSPAPKTVRPIDAACASHRIIDGNKNVQSSCLDDDGICKGLFLSRDGNGVCQRSDENPVAPLCCDYTVAMGCDGKNVSYAAVELSRKCRSYALGSKSTRCNAMGYCEGMSFIGNQRCLASDALVGCSMNNETVVNCSDGAPRNLTKE